MRYLFSVLAVMFMTGCASLTDRRALIDIHYYPSTQTNQVILAFFDDTTDRKLVDCSLEKLLVNGQLQYVAQVFHAQMNTRPRINAKTDPETGYTLIPLNLYNFQPGTDILLGKDFDGAYEIPYRVDSEKWRAEKKALVKQVRATRTAESRPAARAPAVDTSWSGSNLTVRAQAILANAEPDLSKYQRRMGAIMKGGGSLEIEVHYDLNRGNKARQAELSKYITSAFLDRKWVAGATPGISTVKKTRWGNPVYFLAFKKEDASFKRAPKTYNPLCVVLWFTKDDGSSIDGVYYFTYGGN